MLELEIEHPLQSADRGGLEKAFSILVNDHSEHFLPIFVKLLDNHDQQVRFLVIENLGKFKGPKNCLVHTNLLHEVISNRIDFCKARGRFRELYELVELWAQLTETPHKIALLAKEMWELMVNRGIEDEETAAYITLATAVAEENHVEIFSQPLHLFLSSDDFSQWITYQVILPEEKSGETVFKMNLRLIEMAKNAQLSKQVRQLMVVMFR